MAFQDYGPPKLISLSIFSLPAFCGILIDYSC